MIEHTDPTDGDIRPLVPDEREALDEEDDSAPDPDGEAVVVPGQRPGPTEPLPRS